MVWRRLKTLFRNVRRKDPFPKESAFLEILSYLTMALSRETTKYYIDESTLDFINSYMNAMCLQTKVPVYLLTQPSFYETLHILEN